MKRLIIALALFMPTSAMAGQITMECERWIYIGDDSSHVVRYSEGIFHDTIELRVDGEWKEAEFPDSHVNTRISDHSVAWGQSTERPALGVYIRYEYLLDFFRGHYEYNFLTSPDGTDGSWRSDDSVSDLNICNIIK